MRSMDWQSSDGRELVIDGNIVKQNAFKSPSVSALFNAFYCIYVACSRLKGHAMTNLCAYSKFCN